MSLPVVHNTELCCGRRSYSTVYHSDPAAHPGIDWILEHGWSTTGSGICVKALQLACSCVNRGARMPAGLAPCQVICADGRCASCRHLRRSQGRRTARSLMCWRAWHRAGLRLLWGSLGRAAGTILPTATSEGRSISLSNARFVLDRSARYEYLEESGGRCSALLQSRLLLLPRSDFVM